MTAISAVAVLAVSANVARAAEGAAGVYLLGFKATSMPGYTPPPGTYVQSDYYYYSGSANAGIQLPLGNNLALGVDAQAFISATTGIWIAPEKVLGGNVGLSATIVTGWKDIEATAVIGRFTRGVQDDESAFGDPLVTGLIGWHDGNWHWNLATFVNIPVGEYDQDRLANIGFNRWAVDTTGAITYLDAAKGHELSLAAGFTFNGENPDTDYKTGTEFHVEAALVQHLSKQLSIGIAGYHYQQITGDSGSGARLGDFEGRVTGLGPLISYSFECGNIPISTSLRYFKEFDVENRLEGDAGIFTVSMPLSIPGH